jgi:hypothetical protein
MAHNDELSEFLRTRRAAMSPESMGLRPGRRMPGLRREELASLADVLAANRMARLLLADFNAMPARDRNATRWVILDEGARSLFGADWERVAADMVGTLRMDAARHPDDPRTAQLVGELSMKDPDFRRWWAGRKVTVFTSGAKHLHHPLIGELTLPTEAVSFPGDPDQLMIVFLAQPSSPARHALDLLTSWTGDQRVAAADYAGRRGPAAR